MPRLLVLLVVLGSGVGVLAQLPKQSASPEQLVKELGDPEFAVRERAIKALRALGLAALPAIQNALKSDDPEIRRRAAELLPALKAQVALEPHRVTLKHSSQTPSAAVAEISKQTGFAVEISDDAKGEKHDFGIENVTFWEAVERVTERSGRAVNVTMWPKSVVLTRERARSPFVSFDGAFRVELARLHEDRDIDFTKYAPRGEVGKHDHLLTMKLSILAEPRFIILKAGAAEITEAVDDKDGKLTVIKPEEEKEPKANSLDENLRSDYQIDANGFLRRSSQQGTKFRTLTGIVTVRVVVERKRVVVPNFLNAGDQVITVGNETVKLSGTRLNERGELLIYLNVPKDRDGMHAGRWHQRVIVEDVWGNIQRPYGYGTGISGGERHIDKMYSPPKGLFNSFSPNLVIEDWVILEKRVRFAFKDVPLP